MLFVRVAFQRKRQEGAVRFLVARAGSSSRALSVTIVGGFSALQSIGAGTKELEKPYYLSLGGPTILSIPRRPRL